MEKICTNKKILIYPKCALRLTNLKYKVAVDNCSISMNNKGYIIIFKNDNFVALNFYQMYQILAIRN